ncbi:hypothetical protein C8F04DRAFT_1406293 [Mycena alexandri]|uniref:DUF6830 domain-containing protein n=1 Tax=Mycena alexandri TaxID=1745969 RepID=A0AAD6RYQ9_9AGAR|nr:hypothetical protein C8F04DRAFT_1406293 [Mycena alexandri]
MPAHRRSSQHHSSQRREPRFSIEGNHCPICTKKFPNSRRCRQHMNQPNGRCHPGIHLAVLNAAKNYASWGAPRDGGQDYDNNANPGSTDDFQDEFDSGVDYDSDNAPNFGHPGSTSPLMERTPEPLTKGPVREYFEGASRTFGEGKTFMASFHEDRYTKERQSNVYYPFASAEEWEFASFLARSNMSNESIDEMLKLQLTAKMHLSFKNSKDLRSRIEILPRGPQWKSVPWRPEYATKSPLTVYYRDPLECLQHLLSNPLVKDHIHFTPFRLWASADKLVRMYTEWLSGDVAWKMQKQLPVGATLLGTVLSSDKTQLTAMTGNRSAYPVLISLADIDPDFRSKASHHAFLLLILMPIAKFLEKNSEIRGVLASRLFHAILDFVLVPLKETAKIGHMMSDPLGWQRFCYTPLVAYILDTPESLLVAGVAGKRSSVTTASYKEFGDPFRHPSRTRAMTLAQLKELEEEFDPWDLPAYIKAAKAEGLNGVHRPFWRDWAMSEPSDFLTPEILHHWLKMFYDHLCKWSLEAVGAAELDFRFSVLRPHTGMRHFHEGISKAKQTTGREHRDIQRYIVPVIAEATGITKEFLTTIASLVDFFYHGQAPAIDEDILEKMDASLGRFHDHKQAILDAGARKGKKGAINNWHIPKLEFLQSVVPAIRANGVPLQWSADVTEHAHITLVKDPASHSNNQKYEAQICRYLDRRDKCRQFDLATAMEVAGVDFTAPELHPTPDYDDGDDDGDVNPPSSLVTTTSNLLDAIDPVTNLAGTRRTFVNYFTASSLLLDGKFPNAPTPYRTFVAPDNSTAFHLTSKYVGPQVEIDLAATNFRLLDLRACLETYLHRGPGSQLILGGKRPALPHDILASQSVRKLEFWNNVRIQSRSFHDSNKILLAETVNASPPDTTWKFGRGDTVIVNTDSASHWPKSGLTGHTVCQIRMIFRVVPPRYTVPRPETRGFLAYVQHFKVVPQTNPMGGGKGMLPEPASGMYLLKRARRSNGSIMGDVIPLDRLRAPVELTPRFGKVADRRLSKETSLDLCDEFWLSNWFNKEVFFALCQ